MENEREFSKDKEKIIRKINAFHHYEWEFINEMLGKNLTEEIIDDYCLPDAKDELGLITDHVPECLEILMRKATRVMWSNISKDSAATMIRSMQDMNVISIRMKNGKDYTAKNIYNIYKTDNKEES